jgi:excisionase family DNA binding protein
VTTPATTQTIVPRLLTVKQAAVYCSCAVWAIREAVWSKALRACKIGHRYVIPREELDAWVDRMIAERHG